MEKVKMVVRYSYGKVVKGFTQDFLPAKKLFHLTPADTPSSEPIEVSIDDLKAIFIVGNFDGQPQYKERRQASGINQE